MADDPEVKVRIRPLTDYKKDPKNLNRGTPRGKQMIAESFREVGTGRSLIVSGDDVLIGGNHALDGAIEAGITRAIEVDLPPDAVLVARRTDLKADDEKARRMAVLDNRTQQVNLDFDLEALLDAPDLTAGLWRADELDDLKNSREIEQAVNDSLAAGMSPARQLGERAKQIKAVLYVDEVATFEQAIAATGLINRGQAVLEICRVYLEGRGHGQ